MVVVVVVVVVELSKQKHFAIQSKNVSLINALNNIQNRTYTHNMKKAERIDLMLWVPLRCFSRIAHYGQKY